MIAEFLLTLLFLSMLIILWGSWRKLIPSPFKKIAFHICILITAVTLFITADIWQLLE